MSIRAIFTIVIAVIFGASAAVGVNRVLHDPARGGQVEMESVVVAAMDIPRGHMIESSDLQTREWPKAMLPPGAVEDGNLVLGRITLGQMVAGEPVLDAKLGARDAGRGLAALVPKGMRAYTIVASRSGLSPGLSAGLSVAGFILPGNKVDVLLNLKGGANDDTGGGSTTTLLQSIEILAVDQKLDAPSDNKVNPKDFLSVTLLVTPDQAALLDLGQNLGQLALSLRNLDDHDQRTPKPATLGDIRGHKTLASQGSPLLSELARAFFTSRKAAAPAAAPEKTAAPAAPAAPVTPKVVAPVVYEVMALRGMQQDIIRIPVSDKSR